MLEFTVSCRADYYADRFQEHLNAQHIECERIAERTVTFYAETTEQGESLVDYALSL